MELIFLNDLVIFSLAISSWTLVLLLVFYTRILFHPKKIINVEENLPPVSVLVVAKNELSHLKELIPNILAQKYPNFELVIVDDHSWDGSYDYLNSMKDSEPKLQFIGLDDFVAVKQGKKFALTLGIKKASHNHLLLIDADCLPASENWLAQMVGSFQNKEFVLGFSPHQAKPLWFMPLIAFETFWVSWQYGSLALLGLPYMGVGRNLAYKKETFLRHKGFASHLSVAYGDDDLFVQEAANSKNVTINFNPEAHVITFPKENFSLYLRQKKRHFSAGKLYKFKYVFLLNMFWLSWIAYMAAIVFYYLAAPYSIIPMVIVWFPLFLFWIFAAILHYKFKMYKSWWLFPLLFVFYQAVVYPLIGVYVLFSKKELKW